MIDLTKLTDAVTKVASLAQSHANVTSDVAAVAAARDAALADLAQAQKDVDALADKLIAAVDTPAEAVGLAAVAQALAVTPVAPEVPAAPSAPMTIDDLNAIIAKQNAGHSAV